MPSPKAADNGSARADDRSEAALLAELLAALPEAIEVYDERDRLVWSSPASGGLVAVAGAAPPAALGQARQGTIIDVGARWYPVRGGRVAIESTYSPLRVSGTPYVVRRLLDVTSDALLREDLERERVHASVLFDIGALLAKLTPADDLGGIPGLLVPRFCDWSGLYMRQDSGRFACVGAAGSGSSADALLARAIAECSEGLADPRGIGVTLAAGASTPASPEQVRLMEELGADAAILAPLTIRGHIEALLCVARLGEPRFTASEIALVEELVSRVSMTLERTQLLQESETARRRAERSAARLARLQQLTAALSGALDMSEVHHTIIEQASRVVSAEVVALYARDGASVRLIEALGVSSRDLVASVELPSEHAARTSTIEYDALPTSAGFPFVVSALEAHAQTRVIYLPLGLPGGLDRVLMLGIKRGEPLDQEEEFFLAALAHLCAQVIERARLYQAEQQANQEAQEASRLKDEFLSIVSHELRTPLTAILGWAKILQMKPSERLAHGLAVIERNVKTQVRIIDDILDVSRVITGKLRLLVRPVDVASTVAQAIEVLSPTAEARGVRLVPRMTPGLPLVLGDADRLQQVAWNLISNAIKFSNPGESIEITVAGADNEITLVVHDTGRGIKPAFLPFIFDRFRQADSSTTREHGGLGLGLAIVSHLVELHGGTVRAESPGKGLGATFTVTLPVRDTLVSVTPTGRLVAVVRGIAGVRVLIVDDDPDTLDTLAVIVANAGADVRTASSADEALEVLTSFTPELLLTDLAMPGEDGYALLAAARARSGLANLTAIALSASASQDDIDRSLTAGFDLHLVKPIDAEALLAAIATSRHGRGSSAL